MTIDPKILEVIKRQGIAVRSVETTVDAQGRKQHVVEGNFYRTFAVSADTALSLRDVFGDGSGNAPTVGFEVVSRSENVARIRGIASSTSVDTYGTEMSKECLESMAAQFNKGIAYAPNHREHEWDQIIGRSVSAEVVASSTRNPANPAEPQYVLVVENDVDLTMEKGQKLVARADQGYAIGQSIGGWFKRVTYVEGDDGSLERIIIGACDLDHLAATRTPSNPDSDVIAVIRSAIFDNRADPDGDGTMDGEDLIDDTDEAEPEPAAEPADEAEPEPTPEPDEEPAVEPDEDDDDDEDEAKRSADGVIEFRGAALGATLREAIKNKMEKDGISRGDVVKGMADAAKIDVDTVRGIIRGRIQCPPIARLTAFASYLGVSADSLVGAAESDSCTYDRSEMDETVATRSSAGIIQLEGSSPDDSMEAAVPTNETPETAQVLAALAASVQTLNERVAALTPAPVDPVAVATAQTEALRAKVAELEAAQVHLLQNVLEGRHTADLDDARTQVVEALARPDTRAKAATALDQAGARAMAHFLRSSTFEKVSDKPESVSPADLTTAIHMICRAFVADDVA